MEATLLQGESSRSNSSPRRRDGRKLAFLRRSDAIAYGSPYQKAAALVDLAEDGIGLPEEVLDQSSFGNTAKFYFMYIRFDVLWTLNYFAMIIQNFLEKPLWCFKYSSYSCSDREYFFLGQLPYLTVTESIIYEVVTLLILMVHLFFPISYEGFYLYWKSLLNRLKVLLLLIMVADLLVFGLYLSPVAFNSLPFRIAPYIRVVFFILSIRDLCNSILILAGMLGTYLNVLALWLLFLLFSSWLAFVIFEDTEQGKTIFTSYGTTLYQMFVLFTTSNNPDVWIPAYKASRWYCLFIVLYVLVGVYFVTNLILAVVYDSFKSELVKQVAEKDHLRTRTLSKAFNLVDSHNRGYLDKEQCAQLFEELNNYGTLPQISREDFELIFDALDDTRDFKLSSVFYTFSMGTLAHYFGEQFFMVVQNIGQQGVVLLYNIKVLLKTTDYARSHFVKAIEIGLILTVYASHSPIAKGTFVYIALTISSWFLVMSWILAPFIFNPSGFDWLKTVYDFDDFMNWIWYRGDVFAKAEQSWEKWWYEEQDHLRTTGFWGKVTEVILDLRFFFFQFRIVYQLGIAAGSKSILVYLLSWIYVMFALGLYLIIAYARDNYPAKEHIYYRLVQFLVVILAIVVIVALLEFTHFKFVDLFTSLLAFVPTGWGFISISQVLRPCLQKTMIWEIVVSVAHMYDIMFAVIVLAPVAILSWLRGFQSMQTRILFNEAFSRGLQIFQMITGKKPKRDV